MNRKKPIAPWTSLNVETKQTTDSRATPTKQLLLTEIIERYPRMLAVLRELVTDCEAVGLEWINVEWPDLVVTYNKAKAIVESAK